MQLLCLRASLLFFWNSFYCKRWAASLISFEHTNLNNKVSKIRIPNSNLDITPAPNSSVPSFLSLCDITFLSQFITCLILALMPPRDLFSHVCSWIFDFQQRPAFNVKRPKLKDTLIHMYFVLVFFSCHLMNGSSICKSTSWDPYLPVTDMPIYDHFSHWYKAFPMMYISAHPPAKLLFLNGYHILMSKLSLPQKELSN